MNNRYDWICSTEDKVHYDTDDIFLSLYYGFEKPVYPWFISLLNIQKIETKTEIIEEEGGE